MMPTWSVASRNALLQGVVNAVGSAGNIIFYQLLSQPPIATVPLSNPCGTVANGTLTFTGDLYDPSMVGGVPLAAIITTSSGAEVITGLTVGTSQVVADITVSFPIFLAGRTLQITSATIVEVK